MMQWWYGHNAVGFFLTAGFLGDHVLLHPQARRAAGLFLPAVDHPFLGADLPLHLGRPASSALHRAAGLGADARHDLLDHAVDAVLGRHDQRPDDAVGRLGQAAHRSGAAHAGRVGRLLRHVDLRRAADVDQDRQLAQSHYTDWTIGHVHSGALGWVGYISLRRASIAWCRGCGTASGSIRSSWSNWHFWISTIGIVLYITSMWVAGIMQGLMWRAYNALGFLEYSFVETVEAMHPFYIIRALGGVLFLAGALIMAFNLWRTVTSAEVAEPGRRRAGAGGVRQGRQCRSGTSTRSSRRTRSCC